MANPNIVQVSTINGRSMGYQLLTTNAVMIPPETALTGGVPADQVYKINSITIANVTTGTTAWVSVYRQTSGIAGPYGTSNVSGYLAYQIDVPPKTSLSILGKSTSLYLNESHKIAAVASQASTLVFHASFEVIS